MIFRLVKPHYLSLLQNENTFQIFVNPLLWIEWLDVYGFENNNKELISILNIVYPDLAKYLSPYTDFLEENRRNINDLEKEFFDALNSSGVIYQRNGVNQMPGIISLSFPSKSGEAILHRLDLKGIYISTGSACDSKNTEISHVLKAIQLNNDLAEGTIRISFGCNNTKDEARIVAKELIKVVK